MRCLFIDGSFGGIARDIAAVIAEHRRPRHPLAPPRPLLIRNTTTKGTRP